MPRLVTTITLRLMGLTLAGLLLLGGAAVVLCRLLTPDSAPGIVYTSMQDVQTGYYAAAWRGYQSTSGNIEIMRLDLATGQITNLTQRPGHDERPTLAPDGRLIAFEGNANGQREIFLTDDRGSPAINLTRHPGDDIQPSWSPDGRYIAFNSARADHHHRPYLMGAAGQDARPLSVLNAYGPPAWSPDSTQIAFMSFMQTPDERLGQLYSVNIHTGEHRLLAEIRGAIHNVAWSPDGRRIAFIGAYPSNLYVVDTATAALHTLTAPGQGAFSVSPQSMQPLVWSADSQHMLIAGWVDDKLGYDIFQLTFETGYVFAENLTRTPGNDVNPRWTPDESQIMFQSWRDDGQADLYLMQANGRAVRRLTTYAYNDWEPQWQTPQ
jgi:Tol biopolymer transport system component